jgi:hypothetical protein
MNQFTCPCCGHRTLEGPPGSNCICPVCFWEDDDEELYPWGGSNAASLPEAQKTFLAIGACEEAWLGDVRPATPQEVRDPEWLPVEQQRAAERRRILAMIDAAFGALRVGQGMRVYEAELADNYGMDTDISEAVRELDYERYDQVPEDVIDRFTWILPFFDPPGLQLHLAAYMAAAIRSDGRGNSGDSTIYALECSNEAQRAWHEERFQLFDRAQCQVALAFLHYMTRCESADIVVARRARAYWEGRLEG